MIAASIIEAILSTAYLSLMDFMAIEYKDSN